MLNDAMGVPSIEVRVLIEGDEVAVVAFFVDPAGRVELVAGLPDVEFAPHLARVVQIASSALFSGDFKRVVDGDLEAREAGLEGQGSPLRPEDYDEPNWGELSYPSDYPF